MFVVTVRFEIEADCIEVFAEAMEAQARSSLALEEDCRQFDVCRSAVRPEITFLYEIYSDEAAFKIHLESDHFKAFDQKVGNWVKSKEVETWHRTVPA
ncbi:MAG: putative quinol monooxygenase [Kiloniellales bacterium]|nr:putative quinol monooxygenase [Kiloniellales bacterium]